MTAAATSGDWWTTAGSRDHITRDTYTTVGRRAERIVAIVSGHLPRTRPDRALDPVTVRA
jgi:hypothetical protein